MKIIYIENKIFYTYFHPVVCSRNSSFNYAFESDVTSE